jgi:predicted dehydrogenase
MATDRLRVGIIGIGFYAGLAHVPALRATGRAEVVAIARRNPEALAMAKESLGVPRAYTDWHTMLDREQLDAVIVSTPHHVHTEPTLAALDRGLHVLLEKPMALTTSDASAMVQAADRAGRVLLVGYNFRFMGCWRTARTTLQAGEIGNVRQIALAASADFRWVWELDRVPEWLGGAATERMLGVNSLAELWRRDPAMMGGGMFADAGSHLVDLGLWLAGARATHVLAFDVRADLPVEFFVTSQARLANGVLLTLTQSFGTALDDPASRQTWPPGFLRATIFGDRGILTAEWREWDATIWLERAGQREQLAATFADTTPAAAFVAAILDGAENPAPGHDAVHAVTYREAAYRSMREGRVVEVP